MKISHWIVYGKWALCIIAIWLFTTTAHAQKTLGVGTDKPNPRAVLELNVENPNTYSQGLLLPRLNNLQRANLGGNLTVSVAGMSVYDTDDKAFYTWDGTQWKTGSSLTITGINGIAVNQTGNAYTISGTNTGVQFGTPNAGDKSILILNADNTITSTGSSFVVNNTILGLNFNDILFKATSDGNHGLGGYYSSPNKLYAGQDINGPVLYGNGGGALGINDANVPEGIALTWRRISPNNYRVSINNSNVNDVTATLDINGNARIRNLSILGSILTVDGVGNLGMGVLPSNPSQWISASANQIYTNSFVGIGNANPSNALDIRGSASTGMLISATGIGNEAYITLSGVGTQRIYLERPGVEPWSIGRRPNDDFTIERNGFDIFNITPSQQVSFLNAAQFNVGGSFTVASDGNLEQIRGVQYSFPTTNTITGNLFNDGSGNLSWQTITGLSQWVTTTNGIFYDGGGGNLVTSYNQLLVNSASNAQISIENPSTAIGAVSEFALISNANGGASQYFVMGVNKGGRNFYIFPQGHIGGDGLNMDFSGNVGIGVASGSSIAAKLDIIGDPGFTALKVTPGTSGFAGVDFQLANTYFNIAGTRTSPGALTRINNNGTSTTLDVQNTGGGNAASFTGDVNMIGNSSVTGIGYFGTIIGNNLTGASGSVVTVDGVGKLGIGTFAANNWVNSGINSTHLTTGNVGINIASPTNARLEVGGNNISTASAGAQEVARIGSSDAGALRLGIWIQTDPIANNQYMALNAISAGARSLLLQSTGGNVGIGTSLPNQRLLVEGNTSITGIAYLGTIIGNNLTGASGSVVTVDGAGKLGIGTLGTSSQWTTTTNGIYYNGGNIGIGTDASSAFGIDMLNNMARIRRVSDIAGQNAEFDLSDNAETFTWRFGLRPSDQGNNFNIGYFAGDYNIGFYINPTTQFVGIGNPNGANTTPPAPNQRLVVFGNSSVTGIGYLGTINGQNLTGAPGSILTVDGLGNVGMGTLAPGITGSGAANEITFWNGTNTITGNQALTWNSTSSVLGLGGTTLKYTDPTLSNVVIGQNAGNLLSTGQFNVFVGVNAGQNNNGGTGNAFIGYQAGQNNTGGNDNVFMGNLAGASNIGGSSNFAAGYRAGFGNISGNNNFFFGQYAGKSNQSGSNNIAIGRETDFAANNLDNAIVIGALATATGSNQMVLGYNITGLGINTNTPTAMLDVNGGARIRALSVTGSVLTVDGLGNVGIGILATSTNYFTITGSNIRTLNNTDNIQLASIAGAFMIGTNTGLRMRDNGSLMLANAGNTTFTGSDNNFIGFQAGANNTAGLGNNFIGFRAGSNNTTGIANNFIGYRAGENHTSGDNNNFIGESSGGNDTDGVENNFIGFQAGANNTIGSRNIFIGKLSGLNNIDGNENIAIGNNTSFSLSNGTNSIAIGEDVIVGGSNQAVIGQNITGLGINTIPTAMLDVNGGARIRTLSVTGSVLTVDGAGNIGMGTIASSTNNFTLVGNNIRTLNNSNNIQLASTSGAYLIGSNTALKMDGNNSIFMGNGAGNSTITGANNFFTGFSSGRFTSLGNNNIFMGFETGEGNTTGNDNTFFGQNAGQSNSTGNSNIFMGETAGILNETGSYNIAIGASANFASNNLNNAIAIGKTAIATGSNQMVLGANAGSANALTAVGISTNTPTAMLDVNGGARIRSLSVTGSVLTVDGLGNVGMGTIASSTQYLTLVGANIQPIDINQNINISTTTAYRIGGSTVLRKYSANNSLMLGNNAGSAANTGNHNLFFGDAAGNANTTGERNVFMGDGEGGKGNTTGNNNVAIGFKAGGGDQTSSAGNNNNSFGYTAGAKISTGYNNNMFGLGAGLQNTTGFNNNFMGQQAGTNNSIGSDNNFFGFYAGIDNTTGSHNNILGNQSASTGIATGSNNNFIGNNAGSRSVGTIGNNFFGFEAGNFNQTGSYNIAIGYNADMGAIDLTNAIAIGSNTLVSGSNSVVIGNNITSLGINTNTPTAMLDVNGGARIRNLSVAGTIISDASGNLSVSTIAGGSSQWINGTSGQIYTNSFVGVGTSAPGSSFQVAGSTSPAVIAAYNAVTTSGIQGGIINTRSNSTSIYAPGALAFDQSLGVFGFAGYNGTDFGANGPSADIRAMSTQAFSTGSTGTKMIFSTTPNNSNLSIERMTIDHTGYVGIGTTTPIATLHIISPNTITGIFEGANSVSSTPILLSVRNTASGGSAGFYMSTDNNASNAVIGVSPGEMFFRNIEHQSNVLAYATSNRRLNLFESISNSGSMVINATAVGIGVNTFTGYEALRVSSYGGTKGLVMPYVTTAQMVALSVSGLTVADEGMFFWDTDRKDVAIWDGTKFNSRGDDNNNTFSGFNTSNWQVGGNTITGFPFITATGYGKIGANDNMNVAIVTNNQPRIFISTTGGVGINNNNNEPKATLQVNGDVGLGNGTNGINNGNVSVWLYNSKGAFVPANSIVIIGTLDDSFTTVASNSNNAALGVLTEGCNDATYCKVAVSGVATVRIAAPVLRGQHCVTSAIADGQAEAVALPSAGASIGVFLQNNGAGSTARVLLR